jgi:hypothetical protein
MELLLLIPSDSKAELAPSLLPVQSSWTTEPWEVKIVRYQLHGGLIPQAYSSLPDPAVKTREVLAVFLGHRKGTVYLYTKGVKEEILSKSPDAILCVEDSFLTKLIQSKIIAKMEGSIDLIGSLHKRDGLVLYQALFKDSDKTSNLLFHLRVPYTNTGTPFLQLIHSGITTLPMSSRESSKAAKESNPTSLIFEKKQMIVVPSVAQAASSTMPSSSNNAFGSSSEPTMNVHNDQQLTETDILSNLPPYLANAKPIQFLPQSQKLLETATPASVSLPQSPYPYLNTETQMLRGRDRRAEEETDRYTALYYLGLIFAPRQK